MPLSKKKKASNLAGKRVKSPSRGMDIGIVLNRFLYALAVLLMVFGQILYFKSSNSAGILLTVVGILVFAAAYLGLVDLSHFRLPLPKRGLPKNRSSIKIPPLPLPKGSALKKEKFLVFTLRGIIRVALILSAIFLGMRGQMALADMGQLVSTGLKFYFAGVALFLAALWPWKREGIKL